MNCHVNHADSTIQVVLSRSNLLSLLHKLDEMGDSACTIVKQVENGWVVIASSEPDDQHYEGIKRGEMHPLTEAYLVRNNELRNI